MKFNPPILAERVKPARAVQVAVNKTLNALRTPHRSTPIKPGRDAGLDAGLDAGADTGLDAAGIETRSILLGLLQ